SLCEEVRGRRRAVSSVLRLCRSSCSRARWCPGRGGPDAEQHREASVLSIPGEERMGGGGMQSLQWRNRRTREMQRQQRGAADGELYGPGPLRDLDLVRLVRAPGSR
ncbi:unnamed protein product, partial [Gadus morhua 'NCC']